jgi:hypothetical protein
VEWRCALLPDLVDPGAIVLKIFRRFADKISVEHSGPADLRSIRRRDYKRIRISLCASLITLLAAPVFAQQPPAVMLAALGWGICPVVPQFCPGWKPTPYDADVLLIPARGANTVAIHYVVIAVDAYGDSRTFVGDFPANAGDANGVNNSVTIYAGKLASASVTITEIQGPDASGNVAAPVTYQTQAVMQL